MHWHVDVQIRRPHLAAVDDNGGTFLGKGRSAWCLSIGATVGPRNFLKRALSSTEFDAVEVAAKSQYSEKKRPKFKETACGSTYFEIGDTYLIKHSFLERRPFASLSSRRRVELYDTGGVDQVIPDCWRGSFVCHIYRRV